MMSSIYEITSCSQSKPLLTLDALLKWSSAESSPPSAAAVAAVSDVCCKCGDSCCNDSDLQTYKIYGLPEEVEEEDIEDNDNNKHRRRSRRRKTLLCHDMKGGYLDDRYNSGTDTDNAYRFFMWSLIDVFVYFSHHFVTIPPIGWINAGHRNGCPVLGTLIVEGWTQSKSILDVMLKSTTMIDDCIEKLVDITRYYHFDGWLINIESPIDVHDVDNMIYFVGQLSDKMHRLVNGSRNLVIWYDSVITDGSLKWQNELNLLNKPFYDVCDGIFLNYTWNQSNLMQSLEMSRKDNRNYDVYVGVDVFGRNCYGGGGLNTNLAVQEIVKHDLSVAIFASGWTYEVMGEENFTENEYHFWSLLADIDDQQLATTTTTATTATATTHRKKCRQFPIITSFCQGFGPRGLFRCGQLTTTEKWYNLSEQQLQPTNHTDVQIYTDEAFNGGGCLRLKSQSVYSLFDCQLTISRRPHQWRWFYAITYKFLNNKNLNLLTILRYQLNSTDSTSGNNFKTLTLCCSDSSHNQLITTSDDDDNDNTTNEFFSIQLIDYRNPDSSLMVELIEKYNNKFGIFEPKNNWITNGFLIEYRPIGAAADDGHVVVVNGIDLKVVSSSSSTTTTTDADDSSNGVQKPRTAAAIDADVLVGHLIFDNIC
ncbi:cytosolic endo-beta-N-acetylglucosaminidase-like [Oppia nitens]|uniref:cytosolic endo-beta-N-acetylglucosaminidase-like n=1 Tax=Oppia nitens TaxID=1686743 RepID=UPI0023DC9059|nr:cytosolic endo-beta-N-acetylglucosaminidase-like [Oppia nitens]